jgi:hypothetical protein
MLLLTSVSDILRVVTNAAATIHVHASWVDNNAGTVTPGRTNTAAISTATTTTVVAAPAASTQRNVKHLNITNAHATVSSLVTVQHFDGTNSEDLMGVILLPGENLVLSAEGTWIHHDANGAEYLPTTKLDVCVRVTADSTHATAATFADITGLAVAVKAGKHYAVDAVLHHINNATTTGSQFAFGGVAMTGMIASTIDTVTASVTASVHSAGSVAAINTAITAQTTGSATITPAYISGWINPSADGTFTMRATSEVTVASGLIVKAGSWMRVRELDN